MRAAIGLVFACVACGSAATVPPPKVFPASAAATASDDMPAPSGTLRRSEVRDALSAGLGAFLQYISFEDRPVFREGDASSDTGMCTDASSKAKQPKQPCTNATAPRAGRRFVGFRIAELRGPRWRGIDLKPGDVVTAVNGFSIERPEQAQQAFLSLAVASELRVDYERDGQPRTLRLAIVDDQ